VGKASASTRTWAWKRLKLRYILDPRVPEFHAFEAAMRATSGVSDRGLLCLLMLARTDRLFREVTLEQISPILHQSNTEVNHGAVLEAIVERQQAGGFVWSGETLKGIRSHMLSALKDCGVLNGSRTKRTVRPAPGPTVAAFAAQLARLEGLTDRQTLEARWFRLLGLDRGEVVDLMYAATREQVLGFRMQADVVELSLPPLEVASV
jgi:hypothetical protein